MPIAEGRPVVRGALVVALLGATVGLCACAAPRPTVPEGGLAADDRPRTDASVVPATDFVTFSGTEGLPDGGRPPLPPGVDLDMDRVADVTDRCPDTRPGAPVDVHGCALFERVLDGVEFASGDPLLGAAARRSLDRLVADLERYPDVRIRLDGHTDNRGTAASNLALSKRRVMSVARYLVASGISPARLKPYGYGESRPLVGNATAAGRERNRRIEIGPPGPL